MSKGISKDNFIFVWNQIKALLSNKVDKADGKQLSTNDYTTTEKTKLAGIASGATKVVVDTSLNEQSDNAVSNKAVTTKLNQITSQGGEPNTIESIKVNGAVQTPDGSRAVNITVPTKTSDLTNDSNYLSAVPSEYITETELTAKGYQTASDVESKITSKGYVTSTSLSSQLGSYAKKSDLVNMMTWKGTVSTYGDLPESPQIGDTYNVTNADTSHNVNAGDNLTWNGTDWDNFGGAFEIEWCTNQELQEIMES